MQHTLNPFYIDPVTQNRTRATYRITLIMPASHYGVKIVEAASRPEAELLALADPFENADWQYDKGDPSSIEVCDVECEEPPEGTSLIEHGYNSGNASFNAVLHDMPPQADADAWADDSDSAMSACGCDLCITRDRDGF